MGKYYRHKHKLDDLFGIQLVKFGFLIKKILTKLNVTDRFYERTSKNFRHPKSIDWQTISHQGMKVETIEYKGKSSNHCLLQLHGGAYLYDFNDNYRRMAKKYLTIHPCFKVYSPYYSLAPEHSFPVALNEVFELYKTLLKSYEPENIVFTGDSAGGGLALSLAYHIYDHDLPLPKAIITMSPWTDFVAEGNSYEDNKYKDIFFRVGDTKLDKLGYAGKHSFKNEKISPKYGDYNKLPNLLMFVGGNELIKSDTLSIGLKHDKAIIHEFDKMFHVFPLGFKVMSSSRMTWKIIEEYLDNILNEEDENA
ncbi:MAG: alpha/beta hydrolase [Tenericutes bacterium]|jgi:monoterpene epsilon-lactone hydrolase|nr:alpha/beta hydrolase [Mycoplasmatota bacterium]